METLTDTIERDARALLDEVDERGGAARAIEPGFFQEEIARSAYEQQLRVEARGRGGGGREPFADGQPIPPVPAPDYSALAAGQRRRLAAVRAKRDGGTAERALGRLQAAAQDAAAPLMAPILDAVRARATIGEMSDVLRNVWGEYQPR